MPRTISMALMTWIHKLDLQLNAILQRTKSVLLLDWCKSGVIRKSRFFEEGGKPLESLEKLQSQPLFSEPLMPLDTYNHLFLLKTSQSVALQRFQGSQIFHNFSKHSVSSRSNGVKFGVNSSDVSFYTTKTRKPLGL